jgi:hypothetical protein
MWSYRCESVSGTRRRPRTGAPRALVHVGGASREESIELLGAALRSSAIQLMGSGIKSVPFANLLESIRNVLVAVAPAELQIATRTVSLAEMVSAWDASGKPRVVVTIP